MVATLARRGLPGIAFEARAPELPDTLPRMDVAAFVGLAASGPVDLPVAIEDLARFSDVFGGDLPLARDRDTGAERHAYLAPAVEGFFRNGGRRCWVVRVARGGSANRFPVPGLLRRGAGHPTWQPAVAFARSVGSWSDGLRLGSVLDRRALALRDPGFDPVGRILELETAAGTVERGDLLSVVFPRAGLRVFVVADGVESRGAAVRVRWSADDEHWFRTDAAGASPPLAFGAVWLLTEPARVVPVAVRHNADSSGFEVDVDALAADGITAGDVLEVEVTGQGRLILPVGDPVEGTEGEQGDAVRRHAGPGLLQLAPHEALDALSPWDAVPALAERLRLELLVWKGEQMVARLPDLGLGRSHRRCWDRLPTDQELFRAGVEGAGSGGPVRADAVPRRQAAADGDVWTPGASDPLWADASSPVRFPLSGRPPSAIRSPSVADGDDPAAGRGAYLPVGVSGSPQLARSRGAAGPSDVGNRLARNGLARFDAGLFLDPDLAAVGSTSLLEVAHAKAYVRGRALHGLHSLLPVEEVTLVAVPDAVHPGWRLEHEPSPDLVGAPRLSVAAVHGDEATLRWTPVARADRYELQRATDPTFARAAIVDHGAGAGDGDDADGAVQATVVARGPTPDRYFLRVRALRAARPGPWSNTEAVVLPLEPFEPCLRAVPDAPVLTLRSRAATVDLSWSDVAAPRYTVEEAGDPGFLTARTVSQGGGRSVTLDGRHDGPFYFRVRPERPDVTGGPVVGPWSQTAVHVAPTSAWVMRDGRDAGPGALVGVHRALLRFGAARGDLLAVLSVPRHYDDEDAARYPGLLAGDPAVPAPVAAGRGDGDGAVPGDGLEPAPHAILPLAGGEEAALGFGAVYHPWVATRTRGAGATGLRVLPPDGAVSGLIAARTLVGGAWLPPANQPLAAAVGLSPGIGAEGLGAMLDAHVNPLLRDPSGFVVAGADTLGREPRSRPVNVRRLLTLLRRLALRQGATHVFAPHDEDFRRLVRRSFEAWLSDLYARGAFVGRRPSEAFRVVADESVNPPGSVDRGRLVVELHVAPAHPLRFITVRLISSGDGLAVEER